MILTDDLMFSLPQALPRWYYLCGLTVLLVHAVLLLVDDLQSQRQACADRVCSECRSSRQHLLRDQGTKIERLSSDLYERIDRNLEQHHSSITRCNLVSQGSYDQLFFRATLGRCSSDVQATNGVVLATEKKLRSTLIDESTVKKISVVSPNIGLAYSGMGPDSRLLVRRARKQAQVRCLYARRRLFTCFLMLLFLQRRMQRHP